MTEIDFFPETEFGSGKEVGRVLSAAQARGSEVADAGGMEIRGREDTFCPVHKLADGTGEEASKH